MTLLLSTSTHLNKSLTRLKINFLETAREYFLSSKFDNVLSIFFVDDLYQILSLFQNLLGLWHSYLGPQPIWTNLWQDWKSLFMKLHKSIFELEIWQRVNYFFRRRPISNINSVSEPTRIMTLLIRTSTHLNKSLTRLKITFHETAQEYFLSSKFDNVLSTFFVDDLYQILSLFQNLIGLLHSYLGPQPIWTSSWNCTRVFLSSKFDNVLSTFFVDDLYQILSLFQNLLGLWHSYLGPQPIWTSPWQDWKSLFMKLHKSIFELEIWQRVEYFFRRRPLSNITFVSEPTRIMILLLRTSTHLNKSLTRLKINFLETAREYFLSSKFDNVLSTFFVDVLYQILSLFQNLLGFWHSYLGHQPIWTSPWQDWKSLFLKLHENIFWARNLTTCWVLFS